MSSASILKNYPGQKSNSGLLQFFINRIPFHYYYHELFAGSAQLYRAKRPAIDDDFLVEINHRVAHALAAELVRPTVYRCPALQYLREMSFSEDDFIYLDPPYPASARRSADKLYECEMLSDEEHRELLEALNQCPARIMISTRQNALYDELLSHWRKDTFATVDRGGPCEEVIYMNYPPPTYLHQYDYLGDKRTDRQRIKRKMRERFTGKLAALPAYERHLLIQELIKHDAAAVQHFLTTIERGTP